MLKAKVAHIVKKFNLTNYGLTPHRCNSVGDQHAYLPYASFILLSYIEPVTKQETGPPSNFLSEPG